VGENLRELGIVGSVYLCQKRGINGQNEVFGPLVAVVRIFLQAGGNDCLGLPGGVGTKLVQGDRFFVNVFVENGRKIFRLKRPSTCQKFVQNYTKRVNVGTAV
jgi:hypothetical protein